MWNVRPLLSRICVPTDCMHSQGRTSLDYLQARLWQFVLLLSTRFQYQITREKLGSSQLVGIISLIWENISTSQCLLQVNSIKYIRGMFYQFIKFWNIDWILKFDKLNLPLSKKFYFRKIWNFTDLEYFNDCWKLLDFYYSIFT